MSFLDRLFGRDEQPREQQQQSRASGQGPRGTAPQRADPRSPDEIALERYRYLLRTAPPEEIERAHAEAFERLTPEQRQLALQQLAAHLPESEMRGASDDPGSLARIATRAEFRQPGTIERALGGQAVGGQRVGQRPGSLGGGFGGGGMGIGSILLYSLAGSFIGTAIAQSMFGSYGYPEGDPGGDPGSNLEGSGTGAEGGDGTGGEGMGAGDAGQSSGGSWGDGGGGTADAGDFGGGDFGGGDFGGGDFGGGDF